MVKSKKCCVCIEITCDFVLALVLVEIDVVENSLEICVCASASYPGAKNGMSETQANKRCRDRECKRMTTTTTTLRFA